MSTLNFLHNAANSLNALLKAQNVNFKDVDFSCSKFTKDDLKIDVVIYSNGNGFDVELNDITLYQESDESILSDSEFYQLLPAEFKTVQHAAIIRELIDSMIDYISSVYDKYYDAERAFFEELNK